MKRLLSIILISVVLYGYVQNNPDLLNLLNGQQAEKSQAIADAYRRQISDIQISGTGSVKRILKDDNQGSRHQRFILQLDSGQTLLVAHNIDLAPRVSGLRRGDEVVFYGEYEWNPQGGVLHWTHRDPAGRHPDGWLRHHGQTYE